MNDRKNYCLYHHPACQSGCHKVHCRAFFPDRQPLIMESDLPICESLEHINCEQFKAGNAHQEQRRLNKRGCTFLADKVCVQPGTFWCHGNVPPFRIEKDNHLESCFGNDFKDCPYYKIGVAFAEEARRKKNRFKDINSNSV